MFYKRRHPPIDAKLDIGQQELNNKVFIGIENYVLKPTVEAVLENGDPNLPVYMYMYMF